MFYNAIGAVAQCPNNWGVGSVFPTLENTYFHGKFLDIDDRVVQDKTSKMILSRKILPAHWLEDRDD